MIAVQLFLLSNGGDKNTEKSYSHNAASIVFALRVFHACHLPPDSTYLITFLFDTPTLYLWGG